MLETTVVSSTVEMSMGYESGNTFKYMFLYKDKYEPGRAKMWLARVLPINRENGI